MAGWSRMMTYRSIKRVSKVRLNQSAYSQSDWDLDSEIDSSEKLKFCGDNFPQWISFSAFEQVKWLNKLLSKMWPYIAEAATMVVRYSVEPLLEDYRPPGITSLKFSKLTLGNKAPKIECKIRYSCSKFQGRLSISTNTCFWLKQLKDLQVFTVARVIFQLADEIPRISAVVVALLAEPKPRIDYTLKAVRGSLTAIPGLSAMIDDTVDTIVIDMLQWPHRIVFPIGGIPVDLSDFELKPQRKLIYKTKAIENNLNPVWDQTFELIVEDKETQSLTVEVFDKDVGQDERLGLVKLPLSSLEAGVTKELELNLSKMWPYIAETIFRPNGAHRCHNYMKYPNIMKLGEAAILHYTYSKFSDLTARRDRCCCKPKEEDVKICFMLDFDRAISPRNKKFQQGLMSNATFKSVPFSINNSKGKELKIVGAAMGSDSDRDEIEAMTVQELKSHIEKSWAPCERTQTRTYLNFTTSYGQQFYLIKPLRVRYGSGLSGSDHDMEGRMVTAEFDSFYLISTYVPNSVDGLKGLIFYFSSYSNEWTPWVFTYRIEDWDRTLSNHIKDLEKSKPVVLTGDLNCAHEEIDIFNPAGYRHGGRKTNKGYHSKEYISEASMRGAILKANDIPGHILSPAPNNIISKFLPIVSMPRPKNLYGLNRSAFSQMIESLSIAQLFTRI
ncbi:unnamed protein product [Arabidopsis thaliana]|uniref:Uncharacterized protein n=1 Tax=Arabidopsis thaliana TaxID=3702 RepID=A0A5S9XK81_ARATH|nr:unnamed protein product [Arabidopsis thaliana]